MRKKYKITLLILALLILFCGIMAIHYYTYLGRNKEEYSIIEVKEGLSINYINGKEILLNEKQKTISYSITNQSSEELNYYISILNVSENTENVFYDIENTFSGYKKDQVKVTDSFVITKVSILPNETHRYFMNLYNHDLQEVSFELDIGVELLDQSFYSTILSQNEIKEASKTSFEISALESEGLIKLDSNNGIMYYFRGNVLNNYVSFANHLWRIVKINEDGSIKLVLANVTDTMVPMNVEDMKGNTNFETSYVYNSLLQWYDVHLKEYDNYIVSTSYCYDDSVLTDNDGVIDYLANHRLFVDHLPTSSCDGSTLSLKIALLTADEAVYAGASVLENNSYFLKTEDLQSSWWTMTPNRKDIDLVSYMAIGMNGELQKDVSELSALFLKPVISINRKVKVLGMGTLEDPYVITLN